MPNKVSKLKTTNYLPALKLSPRNYHISLRAGKAYHIVTVFWIYRLNKTIVYTNTIIICQQHLTRTNINVEELDQEISLNELENAISKLNNNKVCGGRWNNK